MDATSAVTEDGAPVPCKAMPEEDVRAAQDMIAFVDECPSMFHTAATIMAELDEAGFTYLPENAAWDIEPGGRYYT